MMKYTITAHVCFYILHIHIPVFQICTYCAYNILFLKLWMIHCIQIYGKTKISAEGIVPSSSIHVVIFNITEMIIFRPPWIYSIEYPVCGYDDGRKSFFCFLFVFFFANIYYNTRKWDNRSLIIITEYTPKKYQ